ncbi:sodium / potassium ATPase beta chain domain-containing protein [Phthorimaea operculella]|nr:sodium / potassium ATPase beta chain domain-containing protein [Phthorimaea operculella]
MKVVSDLPPVTVSPRANKVSAPNTPQLTHKDPSVPRPETPPTAPTTSKALFDKDHSDAPPEKCCTKLKRFIYNKEEKTFCGRTCFSWLSIIVYAIMYLLFLTAYTMVFLYITLVVIKSKGFSESNPNGTKSLMSYLTYSPDIVGLTGVPLSEHNYPLIWYRTGEAGDYNKYITALDDFHDRKRTKRDLRADLGPCGHQPYGYGNNPCILIKINKQLNWAGKPLKPGSPKTKAAPAEVQNWVKKDFTKYWLHCAGYHRYDKEHLGKFKYYPDPPGFDSLMYPLPMNSSSPVVAVQVSGFTLGLSVAIECNLWFEDGASSVAFVLYVSPKRNYLRNVSRWY